MPRAGDTQAQVGFAALNNAQWCAAMCRAHGGRSHFTASLWHCDHKMPPLYPRAVTLRDTAQARAEILRKLASARLDPGSTVKDSYATLDLAPAGFAPLFDASWLWRAAAPHAQESDGVQWRRVEDAETLAQWQQAWSAPSAEPVFRPALLEQHEHAVLGGWRGDRIVAGCVASHSKSVIGLSNWFAPAAGEAAALGSCLASIAQDHPALAVTGYETGARLELFQAAGFAPIGRLRVWRKS